MSSLGGIDSDNDVFITATADDVNLAAVLTADNEVTIISTSGSVLQTAGNILATDDVNIDAMREIDEFDTTQVQDFRTQLGDVDVSEPQSDETGEMPNE